MCFKLVLVPIGLVLTLAGWIADTRLGCCNVLYLSSLTMWLSTVLLVISVIIPLAVDWHASYAYVILLVFLGVGYGGFHVIQFGIDQLIGASSDEIVLYIN